MHVSFVVEVEKEHDEAGHVGRLEPQEGVYETTVSVERIRRVYHDQGKLGLECDKEKKNPFTPKLKEYILPKGLTLSLPS